MSKQQIEGMTIEAVRRETVAAYDRGDRKTYALLAAEQYRRGF